MQNPITVEADINAHIEVVWEAYTEPSHIMKWNAASPDWHCPEAEHELEPGGAFSYTMAARDGSTSFDFTGTFDAVRPPKFLSYTMDDGRKAEVTFAPEGRSVHVTVMFEPEDENTEELQRSGWQSILDNFKKYVEENG